MKNHKKDNYAVLFDKQYSPKCTLVMQVKKSANKILKNDELLFKLY